MFGGLGMGELIVIFMVVLLFGAKRLPEIGSSLGKGIREFKGSMREIQGEVTKAVEEQPRTIKPAAPATKSLLAGSAPAVETEELAGSAVQGNGE